LRQSLVGLLLVSTAAAAATPPQGVSLRVRRGFFTETDIGVFFTVGGNNKYSNAETYLQLGLGYDLTERIEVAAYFGLAASAANCFTAQQNGACALSDNFTMTYFNGSVAYLVRLADRLYLTPKVTAGYSTFDPAPAYSKNGKVTSAPNAGGGVGIEYATQMDHFSVGAEIMVRMAIGPAIGSIALFPRIKYTF
jgi:hypothetical protein